MAKRPCPGTERDASVLYIIGSVTQVAGRTPGSEGSPRHDAGPKSTKAPARPAPTLGPSFSGADNLLQLQRLVGNRVAVSMIERAPVFTKSGRPEIRRVYRGPKLPNRIPESEPSTEGDDQTLLVVALAAFFAALADEKATTEAIKQALVNLTLALLEVGEPSGSEVVDWHAVVDKHTDHVLYHPNEAVADFRAAYGVIVNGTEGANTSRSTSTASTSDAATSNIATIPAQTSATGMAVSKGVLHGLPTDDLDFAVPAWTTATAAEVKESGHGGVVIVTFPGGKLVVKGAGGSGRGESFAASFANRVGLAAPLTRVVGPTEEKQIDTAVERLGVAIPGSAPYLVIGYVPGVDFSELASYGGRLTEGQINGIASDIGRWLAFDIVLGEHDRFAALRENQGGINSSNFRYDPNRSNASVVGIDQNLGGNLPRSEYIVTAIKKASPSVAYAMGADVTRLLGAGDEENLGDVILAAAKEQLLTMSKTVDRDVIRKEAAILDIEPRRIEELIGRLEQYGR